MHKDHKIPGGMVTFDEAPAPDTMMTYDSTHVSNDSYVNDNGHLVVDAFISRPGVFDYLASELKPQWLSNDAVQKYPDDAVLRAYRSDKEVSNDEYLNSAKHVPVTDGHPPVMLHPDTVQSYPVGTSTGHVIMDQGKPRARLVLWDQRAIKAREIGKCEVSVGCYNKFVWGPGVTADGRPYDFKIEKSRVNHIAIVEFGRAGRGVKILDSAPPEKKKEAKTMKVMFGSATYDIDDNAANMLATERADSKASQDKLNDELEVLRAKPPALSEEGLGALVDAEIAKRQSAAEMKDMRKAVVAAGCTVDGKTDDRVRGMYEALDLNASTDEGDPAPIVKIKAPPKIETFDRAASKRSVYQTV